MFHKDEISKYISIVMWASVSYRICYRNITVRMLVLETYLFRNAMNNEYRIRSSAMICQKMNNVTYFR